MSGLLRRISLRIQLFRYRNETAAEWIERYIVRHSLERAEKE